MKLSEDLEAQYQVNSSKDKILLLTPEESDLPKISYFSVLEQRKSVRKFSADPLSFAKISYLLFFTASNKTLIDPAEKTLKRHPPPQRRYPSGGSLYPLELHLYIFPDSCSDLRAGLYHYSPLDHSIELSEPFSVRMKETQKIAMSRIDSVDTKGWILISISAQINRISPKYGNISYSLILKEVGTFFQTLYLTASALDLGTCAIGDGPAWFDPQSTRTQSPLNPVVGEMIVGNLKTPPKSR